LGTSAVGAAAAPGETVVSSAEPVEHPLNAKVNTITKIVVHKFFIGSPSLWRRFSPEAYHAAMGQNPMQKATEY